MNQQFGTDRKAFLLVSVPDDEREIVDAVRESAPLAAGQAANPFTSAL
jgi:hypothetical protein